MDELALMAATEWATAHASRHSDSVEFGAKVAQAYLAAQTAKHHAGDELATAAAFAALSIPDETLQALALLSRRCRSSPERTSQERLPDAAGGVG